MSALAKQAISVLKAKGFIKTTGSYCVSSCQTFGSDVIPMVVDIQNDGLIIFTVNDESINNKIKNEDCPIPYGFPYNDESECDLNIIDTIYSSASPYMSIWIASVMDAVTNWEHYEVTDSYGFLIQGVAADPHKIVITITPPK